MNYISSICNPAPGKFMVAKSPIENFNDNSILIVNPGEQAIFINCGQVAGQFDNGRYELSTQNYPFINAFRRFLANGQLTYHCSVFFVSLTQSAEILWGLSVPVRDPVQGIYTKVFARGSYTLHVDNGAKLLVTLLGMNVNFMAAQDLKVFFGNRFQQIINNTLAQFIVKSGREVLALCGDNISIAKEIESQLQEIISDTGLSISNFSISAMELDANDPNRRILEMAYARQREVEILGTNYGMIKDTDVRINASQTPFAGMSFNNPLLQTNPMLGNMPTQTPAPSSAPQTPTSDSIQKLQQLSEMLEKGLITKEEFDASKSQILNKMV